MKRMGYVFLAEAVLAGMLVTLAGAQTESLGDYARGIRKDEKPASAKKYDNDNLPTSDKISVVGDATGSSPEDANAASTPSDSAAQPKDGTKPSTPAAQDAGKPADSSDAHKANDEWKQKISEQQAKVDMLTREVDVTQREYRLRAAAFYADAGNRLRNQGSWDKEDAQYKQDLAKKQKALDDAKKAVDDLKEKARKAGVPSK